MNSTTRARLASQGLCLAFATLTALAASAADVPAALRQEILDAARPAAQAQAGQAVRFVVERLNVDGNWAVLTGGLVQAQGGPLNWAKARACQPQLDKMLWVVLARTDARWRVAQINVCATEPPYWTTREQGGFLWPCGVYAGLADPAGRSLEVACRAGGR